MKTLKSIFKKFENAMFAVTFAEAGEFETAKQFMQEEEPPHKKISKKSSGEYVSKIAVNSAVGSN
ncbi:MAG: hypothetical protein HZA10_07800 [Nitrospirae bacterium]|nr:hypothetical protein [Nitrospirota bacterium]